MPGLTRWLDYHSAAHHTLAPMWLRVPSRIRWRVVYLLNRSQRYCWADLVDAALSEKDGTDHCDTRIPTTGRGGEYCRTVCGFGFAHTDHTDCTCYCGKFKVEPGSRHVLDGRLS